MANTGNIYALLDNTNGQVYFGSTIHSLNKRLYGHKSCYKKYLEGKHGYLSSFEIICNDDYNIHPIEVVHYDTIDQLLMRERFYIEQIDCVNYNIPTRTQAERHAANPQPHRDRVKHYYYENKEKVLERQKKQKAEKYTCDCGMVLSNGSRSRHVKSQFHINYER